jgi:cell division transport system permease protein
VLRLGNGPAPDLAGLRKALAERVPNAILDDHKLWLSRLKAMADTLVGIGLLILTLVLVATALAVAFATRGAMAGTAQIIDVLYLVGAEDSYIARQFQGHFLRLGLKGGAAGALAASAFFSSRWRPCSADLPCRSGAIFPCWSSVCWSRLSRVSFRA